MTISTKLFVALGIVAAGTAGYAISQSALQSAAQQPSIVAPRQADIPTRKLGTLSFTPCTLMSPGAPLGTEAQCTTLDVAENPDKPNGRKISLNIGWIPASRDDATSDPVFMIAGGPGQSATESFPEIARAFKDVVQQHDIILVDQRGTGKSNPLHCDDMQKEMMASATPDDTAMMIELTRQCAQTLSKKADLTQYTTTVALHDIESVRKAIGAAKINLMGVSYGTRVAQQYAMRYPASVRSILLDSVVPNTLFLGNEHAQSLDNALTLYFKQCQQTKQCVDAVGNPQDNLRKVMTALKTPVPVTYRDAYSGERKQVDLSALHVSGVIRLYSYSPLTAALLPLQLHQAANGDYEGLASLSMMLTESMGEIIATGMHNSVICSEDAAGLVKPPQTSDSVLGDSLVDIIQAQCTVWPKGVMPADFHQPLRTDIPTLVIQGQYDPVTPPRYGEDVVKTLRNGRLLIVPNQGHSVLGAGCMPKLYSTFLDTLDLKSLKADCIQAIAATPPFTSFNGWSP